MGNLAYDLIELPAPEPGADFWWANALNEQTNVAGGFWEVATFYPAIWKGGVPEQIISPTSIDDVANDINDADAVVGVLSLASPYPHAFLYSNGQVQDLHSALGGFSGGSSEAKAINNGGFVVGWLRSNQISGGANAFIYDSNSATPPTLLEFRTTAYSINEAGHVLGEHWPQGFEGAKHAFIYRNGPSQDLGEVVTVGGLAKNFDLATGSKVFGGSQPRAFRLDASVAPPVFEDLGAGGPGYSSSRGYAINDAGVVVGVSIPDDSSQAARPFIHFPTSSPYAGWHDLEYLVNKPSGWQLESVSDINNKGEITGRAIVSGGYQRAFVLKPGVFQPADNIGELMAAFMMLLGGVESGGGGVGIGLGGKPYPIDPHGPFASTAGKRFLRSNPDLFLGLVIEKLAVLSDNPTTRDLLVRTARTVLDSVRKDQKQGGGG